VIARAIVVFLSETAPEEVRGGAMGLYRTFMGIGGFIGPVLFLSVFDNYASSYSFYLATIFLVVNASLVATIKSKKPDSDNTATTIIERIREKVKRRKPANHGDL
jgi:MFS family permease